MAFTLHTLAQRPEVEPHIDRLAEVCWPRFLRQHDDLGLGEHWPDLFTTFADFQFVLREPGGRVVAAGQSVPFVWDGTAADLPESLADIVGRARRDRKAGRTPTALSAVAALVDPFERGKGVSAEVIRAMTALASVHRIGTLVAPVRPTLKASYPLVDMERYVRWRRDDGLSLDPWLRVHERLGAGIVRIAPCTLRITGTVQEWEEWTGMAFPDTGPYVVPGALQPVQIDREKDDGRYDDPNVWMLHKGVSR
ncbi:MAG: GNAT family N-acetyltransferase [Candidatus Rokubacteria bacterium]|nr:GNAT family N-acetyltransferase [Candidatus Rokubacteria bacterium]